MPMTSRERLMTALENGRPDRLPCQVHNWMNAYLKRYLPGLDAWSAYERFGMDYAMYIPVEYVYDDKALADWRTEVVELPADDEGNSPFRTIITTPEGQLTQVVKYTDVTGYTTEYLWKDERDFEFWNKYVPVPKAVDFTGLKAARERLGDKGIIRTWPWSPGQGSPWQSFCHTFGTQESIFMAMDKPDWMHYALGEILKKTLRVAELCERNPGRHHRNGRRGGVEHRHQPLHVPGRSACRTTGSRSRRFTPSASRWSTTSAAA